MKAHYITSRVAIFIAAITFMFNQVCEAGPSGPVVKNNNNRTGLFKNWTSNRTKINSPVKVKVNKSPGATVITNVHNDNRVINNTINHNVYSAPNITVLGAQSSATRGRSSETNASCINGSCRQRPAPAPRYEDYYPAPVRQAPPVCYQQPVAQPRPVAYQQTCAQPQQIRPSAPRFVQQAPVYNGNCPPGQQVQTGGYVTRVNNRTGEVVSRTFVPSNGGGGGNYQNHPQQNYGNYGGGGYQQPSHNYSGGQNYGGGYGGQNTGIGFGDNVQYNSSAPVNYRSGGNPNQGFRDMALQYGR